MSCTADVNGPSSGSLDSGIIFSLSSTGIINLTEFDFGPRPATGNFEAEI